MTAAVNNKIYELSRLDQEARFAESMRAGDYFWSSLVAAKKGFGQGSFAIMMLGTLLFPLSTPVVITATVAFSLLNIIRHLIVTKKAHRHYDSCRLELNHKITEADISYWESSSDMDVRQIVATQSMDDLSAEYAVELKAYQDAVTQMLAGAPLYHPTALQLMLANNDRCQAELKAIDASIRHLKSKEPPVLTTRQKIADTASQQFPNLFSGLAWGFGSGSLVTYKLIGVAKITALFWGGVPGFIALCTLAGVALYQLTQHHISGEFNHGKRAISTVGVQLEKKRLIMNAKIVLRNAHQGLAESLHHAVAEVPKYRAAGLIRVESHPLRESMEFKEWQLRPDIKVTRLGQFGLGSLAKLEKGVGAGFAATKLITLVGYAISPHLSVMFSMAVGLGFVACHVHQTERHYVELYRRKTSLDQHLNQAELGKWLVYAARLPADHALLANGVAKFFTSTETKEIQALLGRRHQALKSWVTAITTSQGDYSATCIDELLVRYQQYMAKFQSINAKANRYGAKQIQSQALQLDFIAVLIDHMQIWLKGGSLGVSMGTVVASSSVGVGLLAAFPGGLPAFMILTALIGVLLSEVEQELADTFQGELKEVERVNDLLLAKRGFFSNLLETEAVLTDFKRFVDAHHVPKPANDLMPAEKISDQALSELYRIPDQAPPVVRQIQLAECRQAIERQHQQRREFDACSRSQPLRAGSPVINLGS